MNKDRVKGRAKDVAGRIERQAGEWTGDTETRVKGATKQVEGKAENAWGKAKDAAKKPAESVKAPRAGEHSDEPTESEEQEERMALRRHGS